MTEEEIDAGADAVRKIERILLDFPWERRPSVWLAVKASLPFCVECGYGSPEKPNYNCQCWNDE